MTRQTMSGGGLALLALVLGTAQPARAQTAAPPAVSEAAPASKEVSPPAAVITAVPEPVPAKPPTNAAAPAEAAAAPTPTPAAAKPMPTPAPGKSSAEVEQHIARLRRALKITPAQQTQWDAFAQVMRDNAAHMDSVTKAHPEVSDKLNAVDGLKSYEEVTKAHLEDLQKLEPAFEALYATFTEPQKKVADSMFRQRTAAARPAPRRAPEQPPESE